MPKQNFQERRDTKICVIGDEDTVTGFLMTGVRLRDGQGKTNFFIVTSKTSKFDLEEAWHDFIGRKDTAILIINQHVADDIRHLVDLHKSIVPTVLEIPNKEHPYDANKDSVMQRIKVFYGGTLPDESSA